jgi:uncharacterized protein
MSMMGIPSSDTAVETLKVFLRSARCPPKMMSLPHLDGFLAALAAGPAAVASTEWLPVVWGGGDPTFEGEHEAQSIVGAIFQRYYEIIRQVEERSVSALFSAIPDEIQAACSWGEGFVQAMELRLYAWRALLEAKSHSFLIFPILMLKNGMAAFEADALAKALAASPYCVAMIAEFWRTWRATAGSTDA